MYSFYGGQKGKDFRVHQIFPNRSEGLLKDLQARWYSPVNVGDYVFISYGDIAEQDQLITNENGISEEVPSAYSKNLNIDLLNCGKSYNNSLWQKIYVDEDKQISPAFPEHTSNEENLYIFINFDTEELEGELTGAIEKYGLNINTETGEVVGADGVVYKNFKVPGYSLKETSDIYAEENYGFGYRLIACLTGQTPRIQVYHQTIDIDDGDPYVSLDLTNLEKPKIKFYLHKAQTINECINTIVLNPLEYPSVDLITSGEVQPISFRVGETIPLMLDQQIKFWEIKDSEDPNISYENKFRITDYAIKTEDGWYVKKQLPSKITFSLQASLQNPVLQFELPRAVKFFNGHLFGHGNLGSFPFHIARELQWVNQQRYTVTSIDVDQLQSIAFSTIAGINNSGLVSNGFDYLNAQDFKTYFIRDITNRKNISHYYNNEKSLIDFLSSENVDLTKIPWGIYGLNKENKKVEESYEEFLQNVLTVLQNHVAIIRKYKSSRNFADLDELKWGSYGLIGHTSFESLLTDDERHSYIDMYLEGLEQVGSFVPLLSLIYTYTPLLDFRKTIFEILRSTEKYYYFKPTHGAYFQNLALSFNWIKRHFYYVFKEVAPGDIYIHVPTGRLYQFTDINVSDECDSMSVLYLGALTAPAPEIEQTIQPTFIKKDGEYVHNQINIRDNLLIALNNEGQREQYIFDIPASPEFQASSASIINELPPEVIKTIVENEDGTDGIYNLHFNLPRAIHIYTDKEDNHPNVITGFDDSGEGSPITSIQTSTDELSKGDIYIHTAWISNPPGYDLSDNHRGYVYIYNGDGTWTRQGSLLGPIGTPEPVNRIILQAVYNGQEEGTYDIVYENDSTNTYAYWVNIRDTLTDEKLSTLVANITKDWIIPEPGQGPSSGKAYPKSYYGEMTQVLVLTGLSKEDDLSTGQIENELKQEATYWAQWNNDQKLWYLTVMTSVGSWLNNDYVEDDLVAKSTTYTAHYLNEVIPYWDTDNYYY